MAYIVVQAKKMETTVLRSHIQATWRIDSSIYAAMYHGTVSAAFDVSETGSRNSIFVIQFLVENNENIDHDNYVLTYCAQSIIIMASRNLIL